MVLCPTMVKTRTSLTLPVRILINKLNLEYTVITVLYLGYGANADLQSLTSRDSTSLYNAKTIIMNAFRTWERTSN